MSASPVADGEDADERLRADWSALVAGALDPGGLGGPVGEVIQAFGELGFAELLTDPGVARDQCIDISQTFTSMCRHRGIPASTVTGFLVASMPPFPGEVVLCGHTAVRVPAPSAVVGRKLAIDWTARQFDAGVRVPLVVTLQAWRAFWRDLDKRTDAAVSPASPDRRARLAPSASRPSARADLPPSPAGLEFPAAPSTAPPAAPGGHRLPKPPPAIGPSPNASP